MALQQGQIQAAAKAVSALPGADSLDEIVSRSDTDLDDYAEVYVVNNSCEICTHPGASLFVLVEQFDGSPQGSSAHRAHCCLHCYKLLTEQDARYHGLRVTEISQQDYNAHVDPPLAQSFNGDDV